MGAVVVGYNDRGKPLRKYVSAKNRVELVRKLKQIRRQVDDGLMTQGDSVKLSDLFDRWFEDVMRHQIAPSTFNNYRTVASIHIIPALGKKRLIDLSVGDVDKLLSIKSNSGLAPSTVRRIRAVLAQCLDQGIRWGYLSRNVATLSRSPKTGRSEGRTLPPEQARQLLETLKGHRNEALYAIDALHGPKAR
jgi:site-specific recombinase XerC